MNVSLLFLYIATFYMCIDFYLVFQIASKLLAKTLPRSNNLFIRNDEKKRDEEEEENEETQKCLYVFKCSIFWGIFFFCCRFAVRVATAKIK